VQKTRGCYTTLEAKKIKIKNRVEIQKNQRVKAKLKIKAA
jgi:hypothetical protein